MSYRTLPTRFCGLSFSSLHTDASWRRVLIRREVSQATVVAAAMATLDPLLPATETGQSPATPQEDMTTQYGALELDKDAKEEQRKKDQRRLQNKLDLDGMNKELRMLEADVKTDEGKKDWQDVFQRFKENQIVKRAMGLVENTTRELYMDGRACDNVTVDTILDPLPAPAVHPAR